jgi:putative copper export protein
MLELLQLVSRWAHLTSVALLIGGILYARWVALPALRGLGSPATASDAMARSFRGCTVFAIVTLIATGLFNLLTGPPRLPPYHMWFGIKMLLALHVFAVSLISAKPGNPRRERQLAGTAVSGAAIILIAAYLRRL